MRQLNPDQLVVHIGTYFYCFRGDNGSDMSLQKPSLLEVPAEVLTDEMH